MTCFACRRTPVFAAARDQRDPVPIGKILAELPLIKGVGVPTPQFAPITFEFEGDKHQLPLIPLLSAFEQIRRDRRTAAQYDIVEWRRRNVEDEVRVGIHLWLWPHDPNSTPVRVWILEDGTVDMEEDVDWITPEEWPQHIITNYLNKEN